MSGVDRDPTGEAAPPAPPAVERCYRHPEVPTGVHCTRCERPICTECMIPAPVGYQCPECVQRARREFRQGPGGRRVRPSGLSATKALLAALLAGFVLEVAKGGPNSLMNGPGLRELVDLGAMQPFLIAHGQYWRLFTAIFLHQGLLHIAFNAYALWLFGQFVDDQYGTSRFVLLFFLTGFLASATSYSFSDPGIVGVGASGAVFGIFGAFIAYHFRRRDLAASAASLRWAMTMILLNAFLAFSFRSIDWHAHLGGLVAGFLAGYALEGFGPRRTRGLVAVGGVALLLAVGVALVVWRTDQIRALPLFAHVFGG
jgi:membrane associated rhomboid family serine protease